MASCSYLPYQAKPLDQQAVAAKLMNKDPASPEFNTYLKSQGLTQLPIQSWGLDELTYCALFFNPILDVAKAKWAAAQTSINTAGQRPSASINSKLGHSDLKNGDRSPWAYGLGLDIPLETANKRKIRTEQAEYEAEIADIEIAQTAWQLRSQIAIQLIDYHQSIANIGRWPWSREIHADMIDKLAEAKSKVITNTVFFFEPQKDPGLLYVNKLLEVYNKSAAIQPVAEPAAQ